MKRVLTALLFAVTLFAGCLGSATDTEGGSSSTDGGDPTQGYVEQSQAPLPSEANVSKELGAIQGVVVNVNNASLADAHVSLVGSPTFSRSSAEGRFAFVDVTPGTYSLHTSKDRYEPVEEKVLVTANSVTYVRVVMVAVDASSSGFIEHVHDNWLGEPKYTLIQDSYTWAPDTSAGKGDTREPCIKTLSSGGRAPPDCPMMNIPLPPDKTVYPGAAQVLVTASWKQQEYVKEIYFTYSTANLSLAFSSSLNYASKGEINKQFGLKNGATYVMQLTPKDADDGHARYTAWRFMMGMNFTAGGQVINSVELIRREVGPIALKIEVVKGLVPVEPSHPRFWTNGSRIVLLDNERHTLMPLQNARAPNHEQVPGGVHFGLRGKDLIPPRTTRLEVTLKYGTDIPALEPHFSKKTVAFRTAEKRPDLVTFADLKVVVPKQKDQGLTVYDVPLKAEEADSFYEFASAWKFILANDGQERSDTFRNECTSTAQAGCRAWYELSVVAVNDNYEADFKAGLI